MTAPIDHTNFAVRQTEADFALARSHCIDAFACLEVMVGKAGKRLGLKNSRDCLGRRVAALATAKPSPMLSKVAAKQLPEWIEQCEKLIAKRAYLVHSKMELGQFGAEWRACFANAFDVVAGDKTSLQVTTDDLVDITKEVERQRDRLKELLRGVE